MEIMGNVFTWIAIAAVLFSVVTMILDKRMKKKTEVENDGNN